jgi:hypothetical protein
MDRYFYEKEIKNDVKCVLLYNCMVINENSLQHKKNHIVMSEKCRDEILSQYEKEIEKDFIKAAIRKLDTPIEIESENDIITRNIKHAINLATIKPFHVVILTTEEMEKKYRDNKHLKDTVNILIKTEEEAKLLMVKYKKMCWEGKEYY